MCFYVFKINIKTIEVIYLKIDVFGKGRDWDKECEHIMDYDNDLHIGNLNWVYGAIWSSSKCHNKWPLNTKELTK